MVGRSACGLLGPRRGIRAVLASCCVSASGCVLPPDYPSEAPPANYAPEVLLTELRPIEPSVPVDITLCLVVDVRWAFIDRDDREILTRVVTNNSLTGVQHILDKASRADPGERHYDGIRVSPPVAISTAFCGLVKRSSPLSRRGLNTTISTPRLRHCFRSWSILGAFDPGFWPKMKIASV